MFLDLKERLRSLVTSIILILMLPTAIRPMRSFDKEDIHFARFYKAATQTTKEALREIFVLLFYRAGVRPVECWSTTVAEFCTEILGWSNRKVRETFHANEREKIEEPLATTDYDISLLTKMLHKLFAEMYLPEALERTIRNIKNVRNRVCHEQFVINETDLRRNMEDIKDMIGSLFNEASRLLDIDLSDRKDFYFDEICEIQSAPITSQAASYFENVERFRVDLVGKFITHGRKELMNIFSKLKILNPFTWLSDDKFPELIVDKIFTPLYISDQGRSIDISTLLVIELFDGVRQMSLGVLPSVMILSGIAGCGKTSLCRYILHVWRTRTSKIEGLRSVDILIFVEIRNVTENSLVAYLQKTLLRETCSHFDEKDIILTLQKMNVLFVIDGMDEATAKAVNLVEDIYATLGDARVIITTRPECVSAITNIVSKHHLTHLLLKIKGFTPTGMRNFISKILTCYERDEAKCRRLNIEFTSFVESTGSAFKEHLNLPLTLALLFNVWRDDKARVSKIKSSTQLYNEIFRLCTMKLIDRLKPMNSLHQMEIASTINEWLIVLAKEAFEMLDDGEFVINDTKTLELSSFCRKHNLDSVQTLSAFLICEINETVTGIEHSFSFMHKSQMEYLASLYLLDRMKRENDVKILQNLPSILKDPLMLKLREIRWWNTLLFTLGHLCQEKILSNDTLTEIIRILLKPDNHGRAVRGLWRIIQESDCHPLVCELVTESVNKDLIWKPDPESLCDPVHPMLFLLEHTKITPKGVLIRVFGSINQVTVAVKGAKHEVRPIVNLLPILRCLAKRPSTNVCLRVDEQYYAWGNPENSDEIIAVLLQGGTLTAFMGHLGVAGAESISKVNYLGEVFIRMSKFETLQALSKHFSSNKVKVQMLTLRLDFAYTENVGSSESIATPLRMSIILKEVSDENETDVANMLIKLRKSYQELDLVTSYLTPNGGMRFVTKLFENGVEVKSKITIRSFHKIKYNEYQQLSRLMNCKLEWL